MIKETLASMLRMVGLDALADKVLPSINPREPLATQTEEATSSPQDVSTSLGETKTREREARMYGVQASEKNGCPEKNGYKQHGKNSCGKNSCR